MPLLSQDRPIVAVVTAAGAIMQASSGPAGPDASQGVVESHKLVRVLRGYRDNPQVGETGRLLLWACVNFL